eukprot:gene12811-16070_t
MGKWYDAVPIQVTIGTMPTPGAPFKVVFQNKASSTYFGQLEGTAPLPPTLYEAFLWEQLLGISDNEKRVELVSEMIQVVQTGEEWMQAIPMVTLVTPHPTARRSSVQTDLPVIAVSSSELRMQTMMNDDTDDFSPHPSGTNSILETYTSFHRTSRAVDNITTEDCGQDRGQDRSTDHGQDHLHNTVYQTLDIITTIPESPRLVSEDGNSPYSVMKRIRVTAKAIQDDGHFPKHVIDYMCGDAEEQGKTYGSLARSHEEVTILFMDIDSRP